MSLPASRVAPLLFASGLCALVYQIAWLRELRLVFGGSTAASAAVLAIFMGGLGAGGLVLGARADARRAPLLLYAHLELGVAASSALTPFLCTLVRWLYIKAGGTVTLGLGPGTLLRLVLSALVLLPPTLLMGGTLPAAAKAVETARDTARRSVAVLYGANTLGAVTGAAAATFVLLEVFGVRLMLWLACTLNALLAVIARIIARRASESAAPGAEGEGEGGQDEDRDGDGDGDGVVPPRFVLAASAIVGFAFFLMEIVWYRMLAPILGGSSYTFGLILVVALLGVGLGGALYPIWMARRPATLGRLGWTCAVEALALALPLALGDRLALTALALRSLGAFGFPGLVLGWTAIAAVVVLPAALVSGLQFPLLIALRGRGGDAVGRHVGLAYAWNTAGAIAGSLAGGFGLLPLLSAPGLWRAVVAVLAALGLAAAVLEILRDQQATARRLALVSAVGVLAGALAASRGPTAVWRHAGIGAGRAERAFEGKSPNALVDWMHGERRAIVWEADGVESSVAENASDGIAFVVNGKVDGHVYIDAGTQVMSGLLGALLHGHPRSALVIGLGTGSTAGWLGTVPTLERVDVVELEPAIRRIARDAALVNRGVLDNPRVHIAIGDGRETLLASRSLYDLVFSEPSNPYRAGISSLFTQEFYRATAARLAPGGVFIQWLQAYEVDTQTLRTAYATLASVFPEVATWTSTSGDLVLLASREPLALDVAKLRALVAEEPYRSALEKVWRVNDLEGVLAHHLARSSFARDIARQEGDLVNTDDRNVLEFGFARSVGDDVGGFTQDVEVLDLAMARHEDRPALTGGPVDWASVDEQRHAFDVITSRAARSAEGAAPDAAKRILAMSRYGSRDLPGTLAAWREQPREPRRSFELSMIGECLADAGDEAAAPILSSLRAFEPAEADALLAGLRFRQGRHADAAAAAESALAGYRTDPWARMGVMRRLLVEVVVPLSQDKAFGRRMLAALAAPFAVSMLEDERRDARVQISARVDFRGLCADAFAAYEPFVPWNETSLAMRRECYMTTNHPRKAAADADLTAFVGASSRALRDGFVGSAPPAP